MFAQDPAVLWGIRQKSDSYAGRFRLTLDQNVLYLRGGPVESYTAELACEVRILQWLASFGFNRVAVKKPSRDHAVPRRHRFLHAPGVQTAATVRGKRILLLGTGYRYEFLCGAAGFAQSAAAIQVLQILPQDQRPQGDRLFKDLGSVPADVPQQLEHGAEIAGTEFECLAAPRQRSLAVAAAKIKIGQRPARLELPVGVVSAKQIPLGFATTILDLGARGQDNPVSGIEGIRCRGSLTQRDSVPAVSFGNFRRML